MNLDLLSGGAGADLYVADPYTRAFSHYELNPADLITDFNPDEGDRVDLGLRLLSNNRYVVWRGEITEPNFSLTHGAAIQHGLGTEAIAVWYWKGGERTYLIVDENGDQVLNGRDVTLSFSGELDVELGFFTALNVMASSGTAQADIWTGSASEDVYFGAQGDDRLNGGDAADVLVGGDGDDEIVGGQGDDQLSGGAGADVMDGGNGGDRLVGDGGGDQLTGGAGNDYLSVSGDGAGSRLWGGDGDDFLSGTATGYGQEPVGGAILDGGAGVDTLYVGLNDTASAGAGNDFVTMDGGSADGGAGNDTFSFRESDVTVSGGAGKDVFDFSFLSQEWERLRFVDILDFTPGDDLLKLEYRPTEMVFRGDIANPEFSLEIGERYSSRSWGPGYDEVWTWTDGGFTYVMADLDANGVVSVHDKLIRLQSAPTVSSTDFYANSFVLTGFLTNGDDTTLGTEGADTYRGIDGNDTLNGGLGDDALFGGNGDDILRGGDGQDLIHGNLGDDQILGGDGNDQIYAGGGNDVVRGGAGDDRIGGGYYAGDSDDPTAVNRLYGEDGNDTISVGENDIAEGGRGDDSLYGDGTLYGNEGDDQLSASDFRAATDSATPELYGGDGDDSLNGGNLRDVLDGGAGTDRIYGDGGDDLILGDLSDNSLSGGDGSDVIVLVTGDGSRPAPGYTFVHGGEYYGWGERPLDTLDLSALAGVLTVDLSIAAAQDIGPARLFIQSIHDVILNGAGGVLLGSELNNGLTGGAGADRLEGRAGDDVLIGGGGADYMAGGVGNDTYHADALDQIVELTGEGVDTIVSSAAYSLNTVGAQNVENLTLTGEQRINAAGNALDNVITGNSATNALSGGAGADRLIGGNGSDVYTVDNLGDVVVELANEGTDLVKAGVTWTLGANVENLWLVTTRQINAIGNELDNTIKGNDRANVIIGMGGRDLMTGNGGTDRFDFRAVSDSAWNAYDRITDLEAGDVINLSVMDADTTRAGNQAFVLADAFTGVAGQLTLTYVASGNFTVLGADVDGDGKGDFRVILDGDHRGYANFML